MALPMIRPDRRINEFQRPLDWFGSAAGYELCEEHDRFVLSVEMPGFDPDEISVAWDGGVLNIAAEHEDESTGQVRTTHRSFRFPRDVDEDAIAASYTNGVLEVTLPLEEGLTIRGRAIPVES